jgi:hypothetical protein
MSALDQLAELRARRDELGKVIRDCETSSRFASGDVERARETLVRAERERLAGGSAEAVVRAERALTKARQAANQPWPEKIAGTRAALRDAEVRLARFASENYAPLRDAFNEEAVAAAARVDAALTELVEAHRERELLAGRAAEVFMLVGRVTPSTIPRTRTDIEKLARQAEAAIMAGTETAPRLPPSFTPPQAEQATIEPLAEAF